MFPREEQETSLLFNAGEETWDIMTNIPKDVRQFTKIAKAFGVEPTINDDGRLRVSLPVKAVSFHKPRKKREMTEEQREKARQRFQKMWEKRREGKI